MSVITYTDKHLDVISLAMQPTTRLLTLEGSAQSSKTSVAITAFYQKVYASKSKLFCIAAQDLDAVVDNLLEGNMGLLTLFPKNCKFKNRSAGSKYVELTSYDEERNPIRKKILLCGFSDKKKWKKVLGKPIEVFLIDEVNTADKRFIDEAYARKATFDSPLFIFTLNGDRPDHPIYTERINHCQPLGKVPASILADMAQFPKKEGFYYFHFTFEDNPIMTPQKIEEAKVAFPFGSHYYITKILGERGSPGKMIYVDYLPTIENIGALLVENLESSYNWRHFTVGVDVGFTAWSKVYLTGFTADFGVVGALASVGFQYQGYQKLTEAIIDLVLRARERNIYIEGVFVDNAEANYIIDLNAALSPYGVQATGSYKATIKERIDLLIILLSQNRLKIDKTKCHKLYTALRSSKWVEGREGIEREDKNEEIIDELDSFEYSLTPKMKTILNVAKKKLENVRSGTR